MKIKACMKQIEVAEQALTEINAIRALSVIPKALLTTQIGDSQLFRDLNSPQSIYYNRIKGFSERDMDKLEDIMAHYEANGISPCFDITPDNLCS